MSERLLRIEDAAKVLGVSVSTVKRRIEACELAVFRDGRVVRLRESELRRYVAAKTAARPRPDGEPVVVVRRRRRPRQRLWE
jgi:excisionase family DNA binding protein